MRRFGLIGYPLSHSFSKKYFKEKFEKMGIRDCVYENHPLPVIDGFSELLNSISGLEGLNVTVPYKEKVIPFLDRLEDAAAEIRAVNCIHFIEGKRIGYNTDVRGFKNALMPVLKEIPEKALILGTGGAAKAVAYVLSGLGISYKYVSRKPHADRFTYSELTQTIIKSHHLIVNATPVGTAPAVTEAPDIPYGFLGTDHILFDLIYNPEETCFLRKGREHGAVIRNGYEMLIGQAEASWDIWNRN